MANISRHDTLAQTGQGIPDDARGPEDDAALEAELEAEERRLRGERKDDSLFGENPGGLGPTLGQDLGRPNPGRDLPPEEEGED